MRALICLALAAGLCAQEEAIQNTGAPIRLPFACAAEDIPWAGLSCTEEEPCEVYLELVSFEVLGNRMFASGNFHTAEVTLYSIFLTSEDGGKTWREAFQRIRGGGLDQIRFHGFDSGWVAGGILHPLPRDPFLLITRDGGKTWLRKRVFSDGRSGAILDFAFTSPRQGTLLFDRGGSEDGMRYQLYESPAGGDTWIVREASEKPLTIRRRAAPAGDSRVRADARTRAYHLERRSGDTWKTVAAFLVEVDPCKPPPEPETEPPPEPAEPKPETEATDTFVIRPRPQK